MTLECERMGGVNLAQGVCDTPVPPQLIEGAHRAMKRGLNSYTRFDGIPELRSALAKKIRTFNGIEANPETEIVVSSGSTGSFYAACLALLDPGDEVVVFEPYYGYHVSTLLAVGAVPRFVTMEPPDWSFGVDALERTMGPRTKAIIVNTPGNPSGKVFSMPELKTIARLAAKHDLFVFTDEIYEHFLYDGRRHISPATLPGMWDRTITISGLSKTFSVTGWRIGYSVSARRWAKMIGYMSDLIYVCAPAPLQGGAAAGLAALGARYYRGLAEEFRLKRAKLCGALRDAGLPPHEPQGAYYILADISRLRGSTSKERAMSLLRSTGVAAVPGEAFYHSKTRGQNLARFCFAKTERDLNEACRRLRRA